MASAHDGGGVLRRDSRGRTPLFEVARRGDERAVREMIFGLPGTGVHCQRLALIAVKDHTGRTAAEVARQHGQDRIADLLLSEQARMELFE